MMPETSKILDEAYIERLHFPEVKLPSDQEARMTERRHFAYHCIDVLDVDTN